MPRVNCGEKKLYNTEYKFKYPEKVKKWGFAFREKHRERLRKEARDARRRDPERFRRYDKQKRERHRQAIYARHKNWRDHLRLEMVKSYGGYCVCCGETEHAFLTLDHIQRDGAEHRRRRATAPGIWSELKQLGWPKDKYQLLCMNCNWAKRMGDLCPHERVLEERLKLLL